MELTNEFVIDRGVEETWKILNDLEFIAPCMPGAQLQEIEGDEYRGVVKIKVGPITAQYKGKASFVEQDGTNHVAKLKAEGRDPRQGNANAMVTATMAPADNDRTTVTIHTELGLSGKIASFGRGAIEDVSKKLLGQFTENLREKLETTGQAAGSEAAEPDAAEPDADAAGADAEPAEVEAAPASGTDEADKPAVAAVGGIRRIEGPEAEPVDLLAVTGGSIAKRAVPAAGGLALVLVILYWILGRG